MVKAKAKGGPKVKKKRWLVIHAPKAFGETVLGETHVQEVSQALGKHITVNLMTLTRDMKKQNTNITFVVDNVVGDKAFTKLIKFQIVPSSIKRLVRRRRDRIDDSFTVITKDGIKIRVKPLVITRSNTTNSVLAAMRVKVTAYLLRTAESMNYDAFVDALIQFRIQREMRSLLLKLYPVRTCEIREMSIESERKARKSKLREVKEEEPKEEEDSEEEQTIKIPEEPKEPEKTEEKPVPEETEPKPADDEPAEKEESVEKAAEKPKAAPKKAPAKKKPVKEESSD